MDDLLPKVVVSFVGSGVATAITTSLLLKRNRRIEEEVRKAYSEQLKVFESTRAWKELCLSQLMGPIVMQFRRTKNAFARWRSQNLFLEAKIIRDANLVIRDLLLSKGHLIPHDLLEASAKLIEHYDIWLEAFEEKRGEGKPASQDRFVFVGHLGFPFPREAEEAFWARFEALRRDLYGV